MTETAWAEVGDLPAWLRPLADASKVLEPEQLSMFLPPEDGSGRASAVLICAGDGPRGPSLLLSQRSAELRKHAGQVAFPGGAVDPADQDHLAAALREAEEEVGLDPESVLPIAELPAIFIPVTGFVVVPILAWWRDPHPVAPIDSAEVARVVVAPIAELVNPANRFRTRHPSGWLGPGFEVDGLFIWGFTAGLIDRLLTLGGWALPWDTDVERPLPPHLVGRRS